MPEPHRPQVSRQPHQAHVLRPELIARTRTVAEPRWAPGEGVLAWVEAAGGRADLVLAPADRSAPPTVVTAVTGVAPVGAYGGGVWCWAGPAHVVVVDPDGRLVLLPVDGGEGRVLSGDGRAAAPAAPPAGGLVAFVVERDDACDVMVARTDGRGAPWKVSHADYAWDPAWSPDGSRLAWHEWDLDRMSWDGSRIVVASPTGDGARVVAGGTEVSVGQPRFSPDGSRLAWVSDEDGWWNVRVGTADGSEPRAVLPEPHEHAEPAWGPGQRSFAWSPDGASIALCRNECGYGRLAIVPLHDATAARDVAKGWHHGLDWGAAGVLAVRSGARTPPNVCVTRTDARTDGGVDGATDGAMTGSSSRTLVARGAPAGFEVVGLVEPEPVSWASDDGEVVHGMLFRPSSSDGPPPLLVDVHGGPTGQGGAHWRPFRQYFVSRGWAVLAPDHRGSTGYGRAYTQALREQWGVLDVADCASGIRAAGEQGWGDPARVAACGGSAGGLTVLLLAAQHGDLLRAVVGMYPVTDLFELAATTHRFESRYLDRIVGTLPGDAARYHDRSPVTHAASIRVPTLVLQGSNDRVVLPAQARVLVDAISAAGGTAEHHVYEGEGHGWAREETILDVYARVDDFLRHWVLSG